MKAFLRILGGYMDGIQKHILLVDDSVASLKQAQALLHEEYKISMVKSGELALDFLSKIRPDLILLDVEMPDMDGFETIKAIRENEEWKKIPVIFLTGNTDAATEVKCFEYGALDFITKPFVKEIAMHRIACQLALSDYSHQLENMVEERTTELLKIMSEKQRISAELDLASDIQNSMLPSVYPVFPDRKEFDLHTYIETAVEVGGDFFNYRMLDDDHLLLVIADVVGKGIPAALFMVRVTTLITAISKGITDAAKITSVVNDLICENNGEDLFTTAFFAVVEISTGKFTYCSAGHNPPVLIRSGENAMFLEPKPNMVLGAMGGMEYSESSITLREGDGILLYTDGVDEAMDKDKNQYGPERLISLLNTFDGKNSSALDLTNLVRDDVKKFVNGEEQSDDITMVSFIYKGNQDI